MEARLKCGSELISPLVERETARIRGAVRPASLNVIPVEHLGPVAPGLFAAPAHADAVPDSTEEEYDAAIQTLQAMFSLPRRVAARALAKSRLRLPMAIELLLDKTQRDALVADSGLVVPPAAPQAVQSVPAAIEPRAALKVSDPRDLISFDVNQPCVTRNPSCPR